MSPSITIILPLVATLACAVWTLVIATACDVSQKWGPFYLSAATSLVATFFFWLVWGLLR